MFVNKHTFVYGSDVQRDTVQLPTSHSQRLNKGKSLAIGRCDWLVSNLYVVKFALIGQIQSLVWYGLYVHLSLFIEC